MPKANPEAALAEFERLAAAADVSTDTEAMDAEAYEEFAELREVMTQAIVDGRLAVDSEGQAVLSAPDGKEITFRIPIGKDLMIMANAREDRRVEALLRFLCSITGQSTATIEMLPKRPFTLAIRLAGFLAAV